MLGDDKGATGDHLGGLLGLLSLLRALDRVLNNSAALVAAAATGHRRLQTKTPTPHEGRRFDIPPRALYISLTHFWIMAT
jgi:hypothetical protein